MVEEVKAAVATTLVVSVGLSVGLSVATGVASSAAAATAAAAGGAAVGGAAAGGTAGASGAGGLSSGGGAMLPLIFGVQRFANSEGLGVPVSNVQRAVAGSIGWASGELPIVPAQETSSSPGAQTRRRLSEGAGNSTSNELDHGAATTPAQLAKLLNLLTTWLLSVALVTLLQGMLVCLWRHALNRRYYRYRKAVKTAQEDVAAFGDMETPRTKVNAAHPDHLIVRRKYFGIVGPKCKPRPPRFTPWPKSLVWPTPLVFACCIFVTGLTRESVRLLVAPPEGGGAICVVLPVSILLVLSALFCVTVGEVVVFHRRHNAEVTWKPAPRKPKPQAIGDPYMRAAAKLLAAVRRLCAGQGRRVAPSESNAPTGANDLGFSDRKAGGFSLPTEDAKEPGRTERLLAAPFAFRHKRAGDVFQAMEGFLLFRVNASSRVGMGYRLVVIGCNMLFGALAGLRPVLHPGSTGSSMQAVVICALQFSLSLLCFVWKPDADRVISTFAGTQFLFEGLSTAVLLGPAFGPNEVDTEVLATAFALSIVAMLVPILQLLEQRLVTPTVNVVSRKGCDPFALMAAAWILLVSLPSLLMKLITSIDDGAERTLDKAGAAGSSADAGDEAAGDGAAADAATSAAAEQQSSGVGAEVVVETATKSSKLIARSVAAKEASAIDATF